jgi:alpha-L-fucosidase
MKRLYLLAFTFLIIIAATAQDRAAWLKEAKWGIMVHYLADWRARTDSIKMSPEKWIELIDRFNADSLAAQVKSVGAGYLIFTIGQNSGYYDSPNKTYEKLTAITDKISNRDLIADLSDALRTRGLKFIVYLPSGAPNGDSIAKKKLEWTNGPYPNKEFQQKWEAIIKEWSLQWKNKIDGWWFDGCYWPNIMYRNETTPNFKSFAEAARAGNPNAIVAFNPGVVHRILSLTPYEDYTAGENDKPDLISIRRAYDGKVDGKQIHALSYLGRTWGMGDPRFTSEQIVEWSKSIIQEGGAITWDTPVQSSGLISASFLEQLTELGKSLNKLK